MTIGISWYALEKAAAKYNLEKALLRRWVEQGIVRSEAAEEDELLVNVDDLELKLRELTVL
jgi:hypothetical protein